MKVIQILKFENYKITRTTNFLELTAEPILLYESSDNEEFLFGTPQCWDDDFLAQVPIEQYTIYFVSACMIPYGQYNRITDYQKVWKLKDIEQGIFDGFYDTVQGRTYFGLAKAYGNTGFHSNNASLVILIPKEQVTTPENIFRFFKDTNFDFACNTQNFPYQSFSNWISNSIVLQYSWGEVCSLSLYGQNIQTLFQNEDIYLSKWEKGSISTAEIRGL